MERKIENESFDCIATIRVKTESKYIITILSIAKKFGFLTSQNLRDNLLPNQPITMAENIIKRYQDLGFIDYAGNLTELGKMAINGDIYMPEQGEYEICATPDELFNNSIIEISRVKWNENKADTMQKPEILRGSENIPILVLLDGHKEVVIIESIDNKVQQSKSKNNFSIEVVSNYTSCNVTLKEDGKSLYTFQNNKLKIDNVWNAVKSSGNFVWKGKALLDGFALVSYEETSSEERKSFSIVIPQLTLNLPEFGSLKSKPITVKIQPVSQKDADQWAHEIIKHKVDDFITAEKFMSISEEVRKQFKVYTPQTPTINEMIRSLYDKSISNKKPLPHEYWYLQAPVDLSMEME